MKKHIDTNTDNVFSSFQSMFWFAGVVESIGDPLQQGRVQARCIGYHPDNKSLVPTEDLPWAHVMLPTTSAGVSGIGSTHGLVEGSWVIGFFADGRSAQQPIVIGTIPGNPVPSRSQSTLLRGNQSIAETSSEGVAGIVQSTNIGTTTSATLNSMGIDITDSIDSTDLTGVGKFAEVGLNLFDISNSNSIAANNILKAIASSNDLRISQLYESIKNNEKLTVSTQEGRNILNYVNQYSNSTFAELVGFPSSSAAVVNPKANTVDVNVNYEKALDDSTTNAGLILIENNNVKKSQAGAPISKFKNLDQYHFVISAQGQIFPKNQLDQSIDSGDGLEKIIANGTTHNTIRVCLIGGLPDNKKYAATASYTERFTTPQVNALIRLLTVLLKKYPKAVISGKNNLSKDGGSASPGFDVTEAFKDLFPNNVNKIGNSPKIIGADSVKADEVTPPVYVDNNGYQDPRGVYPAPNYGSDYPLVARTNALSGRSRMPKIIAAIKGNVSKFSIQEPRNASDRTAVGIVEPTQIKVPDWGGEYGMTHVIRETPGGHAIYADDTPGKQRLVIVSPTGSVIDLQPDGSIVHMSQGNTVTLTAGNENNVINGESVETINGTKKIKIAGDFILEVGGRFGIVAKEFNEFISGDKMSLVEGFSKQQAKSGIAIETARDMLVDVGGNRQDVTVGAKVDQVGASRTDVTTGTHTSKSNYSVDTTLGNRIIMTKGNLSISSNGKADVFAKGDMSVSSAGKIGATAGGKMSIVGDGVGINSGGNMSLDADHISFQEGTIAESITINEFDYPETIQPITSPNDSESNPAASDFTFGRRHEMEAHPENGASALGSRSAYNSGATRNTNSPASSHGSQTNLDPVSLGSRSGTGCEVAGKLVQRGMTQEAAAAYAGAFMQESGYNPSARNRIGAEGIAQWTSSGARKEMMKTYLGPNWNTVDGQLDYVMYELKNNPNGNAGGAASTWQTADLAQAIKSAAYYERFKGFETAAYGTYAGEEWGSRAGYAASIYRDCFGKDPGAFNPVPNWNAGSGLNQSGSYGESPTTGIGSGSDVRGNEKNVNLPPMSDKYVDRSQKISEFFCLADLLQSGGNRFEIREYNPTPAGMMTDDELVANLSSLCVNVLDVIYRKLGKVTVNSGWRPASYNNKIGGAKNSQHTYGRAADITVAGYSPAQVYQYVINNIPAAKGVGSYPTFTHVDVRPNQYRSTWSS